MNPLLDTLQPYPFERLRTLLEGVVPSTEHSPISLAIGEPRHATPPLIRQTLADNLDGLSVYPATAGDPALRTSVARWLRNRYGVGLRPADQILPVNGSREALFALAQCVIDPTQQQATVVCPNPFYQIYEGAALLAGARTHFVNADPRRRHAADWASVDEAVWSRTQLLYVCSPGNPTGAVMPLSEWAALFALSDRHGFVIASDECYSEIYAGDIAPLGSLQAAAQLGRADFRRLVAFTSLSKRSNVPGLRSGFVAGDADVLRQFLLYRTYHGSAMGLAVQRASIAAWDDEAHVRDNRAAYKAKFDKVIPILTTVMPIETPDAGFYLWPDIRCAWPGGDDVLFARELLAQYNVRLLPGSLLARDTPLGNPGAGRIRLALVAELDDCIEAARRIVQLLSQRRSGDADADTRFQLSNDQPRAPAHDH